MPVISITLLPGYSSQAESTMVSRVALAAGSREGVDALHASALGLGASDEGAPGERMPGFYGAYFRDLDGNKLCACHFG